MTLRASTQWKSEIGSNPLIGFIHEINEVRGIMTGSGVYMCILYKHVAMDTCDCMLGKKPSYDTKLIIEDHHHVVDHLPGIASKDCVSGKHSVIQTTAWIVYCLLYAFI
jgi:hypothetical protein